MNYFIWIETEIFEICIVIRDKLMNASKLLRRAKNFHDQYRFRHTTICYVYNYCVLGELHSISVSFAFMLFKLKRKDAKRVKCKIFL